MARGLAVGAARPGRPDRHNSAKTAAQAQFVSMAFQRLCRTVSSLRCDRVAAGKGIFNIHCLLQCLHLGIVGPS